MILTDRYTGLFFETFHDRDTAALSVPAEARHMCPPTVPVIWVRPNYCQVHNMLEMPGVVRAWSKFIVRNRKRN